MNDERKFYLELFRRFDRNRNGVLEFGEFYSFFKSAYACDPKEFQNSIPKNLPTSEFSTGYLKHLFNGIDIMSKNTITPTEAIDCIIAIKSLDELYQAKITFRALDKDRSNCIDLNEISGIMGIFGNSSIEEKFQNVLENVIKNNSGKVKFHQFYEILFKKQISENTDPYDGKKIQIQSNCCLLF